MIAYNPTRSRINTYAPAVNTPVNTASAVKDTKDTAEQNVGGFLGGLGYLGEKIGLGALSWAEGVADFIGAGFSSLIGREDWAEDILANDWVNYNDADEWFNPSDGWKMAGDVAQGIGNSIPSIATTAVAAYFTGGLSLGAQAGLTFVTSGLSASGRGVKEAYGETGTLGGKEWMYGIGVGALEGGVEAFSDNVLGLGTGVIKQAFGRNTAKALVRDGIGKTLIKSFTGEALEEGVSEFFTPYIKRATYDAQAENASIGDIAYASLIGGLSGMVMGGVHSAVGSTMDTIHGAKISQDPNKVNSTIETARSIVDTESQVETESDAFARVRETLSELDESLKTTNGEAVTLKQKRLLGELQNANTVAVFQPMIWRQGASIVQNAEQYAAALNQFFADNQTGEKINVTAEELTKGIDFSSNRKFRKTFQKALKENIALRTVTVYEVANRLSMDTEQYAQAFTNGTMRDEMVTQDMINRFVENGTDLQIKSVQDTLGIEDLRTATADEVNAKLAEFVRNGGAQRVADNNAAIKSILADETIKTKNSIPKTVRMQKDGTTRYTQGGVDIAIVKNGETFRVYDYTDNVLSREMTREEAQRFVNKVRAEAEKTMFSVQNNEQNATEEQEAVATEETTENEQTDVQNKTAEIDDYAKREIKEYNKLSEPNKRAVRFTIRQAIANGVSEEETIRIARVAARSGLNIVFDKEPLFIKTSEDGTDLYADAMYRDGTVYLNRDKSENKTYTALLTHEMMHALFKEQNGRMQIKLVRDAIRNLPKEKTEEWAKQYKGVGYTAAQFMDELVAKHAEIVLGDADVWEYILSEDASKKNKVLSFFSRAAQDYSGDEVLSRSARKLLTQYRKMFNQLADRTQGSNADRFAKTNRSEERGDYSFAGETAKTADNTMLSKAKEMLKNGSDPETIRKETGWFEGYDKKWRFEIDDSKSELNIPEYFDSDYGIKLSKILKHEELLKAYPFLNDVDVFISNTVPHGAYVPSGSVSSIGIYALNNNRSTKWILIHEIQHLIQNYEKFATGASPKQFSQIAWGEKEYKAYDKCKEAAEKLYNVLKRNGIEIDKSCSIGENEILYNEVDKNISDNYMLLTSLADRNKRTSNLLEEYYDNYHTIYRTTPNGQYNAVAGEIEAYDTQARMEMTAEERKNTRPNIDRTDVVFADAEKSFFVAKDNNGNNVAVVTDNVFYDKSVKKHQAIANNIAKNIGKYYPIIESGQNVYIGKDLPNEYTQSEYTKHINAKLRKAKGLSSSNIGEMIEIASDRKWVKNRKQKHNIDAKYGWYHYTTRFAIPVYDSFGKAVNFKVYTADLIIRNDADGKKYLYDIQDIKQESSSNLPAPLVDKVRNIRSNSLDSSISENNQNVNPSETKNFSLPETDSDGNKLSAKQIEYFKESKVRDENGNLLVVYHGTDADFDAFDMMKAGKNGRAEGYGFYFSDDREITSKYGEKQKKVYLNIKKPMYPDKVTLKKSELIKFVNALINYKSKEYDESWQDSFISNYVDTYGGTRASCVSEFVDQIMDYNDNDQDLIYEIANGAGMNYDVAGAKAFYNVLYDSIGVDGNIATWEQKGGKSSKVYVTFHSKQSKYTSNTDPTSNDDLRYSLPEDFERFQADYENKVDLVLSGKYSSDDPIIVGRTPDILTEIGVNQLPITISKGHIYSIAKTEAEAKAENRFDSKFNYHGFGEQAVKDIGKQLQNPIMVLAHQEFTEDQRKNAAQNHKITVVVELNVDGKQVICPITIDANAIYQNNEIDSNHINTYFDRGGFESLLKESIAKENVGDVGFYYLDKKRSESVIKKFGQQLPDLLKGSRFNTIIRRIDEKVNRKIDTFLKSAQFTRWFGDWQNNPSAASKAVNEDGTPKIYYHGTPNKFTVFDIKKAKPGFYGRGFYFSTVQSHSNTYGETGAFYLNIRNPLSPGGAKVTRKQIRRFLELVAEDEDLSIENYGTYNIDEIMSKIESDDAFAVIQDVNSTAIGDFGEAIKIFNFANKTHFDGVITPTETVVYDNRQMKSANRNIGTYDGNNPDYMYSLPDSEIKRTANQTRKKTAFSKAETDTEDGKKGTITNILTSTKEEKTTKKQTVRDAWEALKISLTDEQAGIVTALKKNGMSDEEANALVQSARASYNAADAMLGEYQYVGDERVGKGLSAIFNPILSKGEGYTGDFYTYMLMKHHIDRIKQGKTVMGDVSEADARRSIAILKGDHPEFEKAAEDVFNYNKNLLKIRKNYGLISEDIEKMLDEMYPHYVPTFRANAKEGIAGIKGSFNTEIKQTVKGAKGSTLDIMPIVQSMARQTMEVYRAGSINKLMTALYEQSIKNKDNTFIESITEEKQDDAYTQLDTDYASEKKQNQVTFYYNGKKLTAKVTPSVYQAIESFAPRSPSAIDRVLAPIEKVNDLFKKGVTSANPFFVVRNFLRDFQEALVYTQYSVPQFIKSLAKAYKQIASNGEMWNLYKAAGGLSSSIFDFNDGIKQPSKNKLVRGAKAVTDKIEWANMLVEQAPRLAEFMLAKESGKSTNVAILEAADVTTNFARGGKLTKTLNRTVMPFLNPSVQGWSKLVRTATGRKNAKQWMMLIVRALLLGIGVTALNDLLNDDNENYKALSTQTKENYYVIDINGDGTFIKIPKGRVVAMLGSMYLHGKDVANGDEKPLDAFSAWLSTAKEQVSPVENFTRTIFSPFDDVRTNTSWYGTNIESQSMQNLKPSERYDANTSKIAIGIGKILNYSPKKIHYLIDQYTGIIGDVILPATTAKGYSPFSITKSAFTVDSVTANRYANDFYDKIQDLTYKKYDGDVTSALVLRYLNSVSTEVSDMYGQKSEIDVSDASDKFDQSRVMQGLISQTQKSAIENAESIAKYLEQIGYADTVNKFIESKEYDSLDENGKKNAASKLTSYYLDMAKNKVVGTEMKTNNLVYSIIGKDNAFYVKTAMSKIESDKDKNGDAITGSKKQKTIKFLLGQNMSDEERLLLLFAHGYKLKDGEYKGMSAESATRKLLKYILRSNLTREEKALVAEKCGFDVKNGKIITATAFNS